MRVAPIALALLGTALFAEPAKADPYPWCAVYGNTGDSRESCYYLTFEACLAQISRARRFLQQQSGIHRPRRIIGRQPAPVAALIPRHRPGGNPARTEP